MNGNIYTEGIKTNPSAATVLATSGSLDSKGTARASYKISVIITVTVATTFRLELLDGSSAVQKTLYFAVPANDTKIYSFDAAFFINEGWTLRLLNNTTLTLGAQAQGSLVISVEEID